MWVYIYSKRHSFTNIQTKYFLRKKYVLFTYCYLYHMDGWARDFYCPYFCLFVSFRKFPLTHAIKCSEQSCLDTGPSKPTIKNIYKENQETNSGYLMILKQYYSWEVCLKCYSNIGKIIFIFWRNALTYVWMKWNNVHGFIMCNKWLGMF